MVDLLEPTLAGAGGGVMGVIMAWLGIKSRLDQLEKSLEKVVDEKACSARTQALTQRIDNSVSRFNKIDANIDVITKILLEARRGVMEP